MTLDTEILRIKREGVNVDYRIARAKLDDAQRAVADGAPTGDEHQANENVAEAARQAAIDAWLEDTTRLSDLAMERQIIRVREEGRSVEVGVAQARLDAAQRNLANGDRAAAQRRSTGPLALAEPLVPSEHAPPPVVAEETPTTSEPTPPPSTPTPIPAPTSAPALQAHPFAQLVKESQARALRKHPDLGTAGSPLNLRFVTQYQGLQAKRDPLLRQPDWPEKLADDCADPIASSGP